MRISVKPSSFVPDSVHGSRRSASRRRLAFARPATVVALAAAGLLAALGSASFALQQDETDPATAADESSGAAALERVRKGDSVELTTTDSERYRGRVLSVVEPDADNPGGALIIRFAGELYTISGHDVASLVVTDTAYRRYVEARLEIDDDDVDALLVLIRWLRDHELYEAALEELDGVLDLEPTNAEALRLRRVIRALRDMEERQQRREAERVAAGDGAAGDGGDTPTFGGRRLRPPTIEELPPLTEDQINLLKVLEIDLADPPRLVIRRPTIERLIRRYATSPLIPSDRQGREEFRRLEPVEILEVMFRLQARELYPEVTVLGNPTSIDTFRDVVQTRWLANRCGSLRCHGSVDAGRFQLINARPGAERALYTNFAILDAYESEDGLLRMIDWDDPEQSLLVQMGLPRQDAFFPHPDVPGYRPVFGNRDSDRFQDTIDWIESMYRPRPVVDLDWEPPHARYDRLRRESSDQDASDDDSGEAPESDRPEQPPNPQR